MKNDAGIFHASMEIKRKRSFVDVGSLEGAGYASASTWETVELSMSGLVFCPTKTGFDKWTCL